MAEVGEAQASHEVGFESHGVRVAVESSEQDLLEQILAFLPPDAKPCPVPSTPRFGLWTDEEYGYRLTIGDEPPVPCRDRALAIGTLQRRLGGYVAAAAVDRVAVHAGAVAHRGRAILIPGYSFTGKTTLVSALVDAGATLYSDEYAAVDGSGLVHPYPQPLSVRNEDGRSRISWPEAPGERRAEPEVPVGLVAITAYRAGAAWNPRELSAGAGAVALLAHALSAQDRPAHTLGVVKQAVEGALILEGERGEASEVAPALLNALEGNLS